MAAVFRLGDTLSDVSDVILTRNMNIGIQNNMQVMVMIVEQCSHCNACSVTDG